MCCCWREKGFSGRGPPLAQSPPQAAVAETAAFAERDALGGMHQPRKAHPRCTAGAFQGRAVAWLFPRVPQVRGRRGGLQQGVEIFQPLGFIFPVCVSQQNITQVTFSAPLRKFRGGERSVPSHLPLLRPCQRVRSPAAQHRGAGAAPCPLNKRVRLPLCSVLCRSKDGMSLPTR